MNQHPKTQPWIAVVLSLCCTGLGHLYCGRLSRGLVTFLLSLLILPVAAFVAGQMSSTLALVGLILSIAGLLGLWLFAVVDAWRTAVQSPETVRHDYQKPLVYGLFVAVGIISPMLSAVYIRQNLLEAFCIPSASMSPYLQNGDRILVNKALWRTQQLKRYDVVVFRAPDHPEHIYVKRIIALPGELVQIEGNTVKVNGASIAEPDAETSQPLSADGDRQKGSESGTEQGFQIPLGMCYVLGDNRSNSNDSRNFGPVALAAVLGVVEYVYLPGDTWSRFGRLP